VTTRERTAAARAVRQPGRNDPCPCGSGRKYKHCCASARAQPARTPATGVALSSVQRVFLEANAAYQRGELDAAERGCRQILAQHPNDLQAINLLGVVAFRQGVLPEAERWLRRAIALDPREAQFRLNLGKTLRQQLRPDEAVEVLRQLLELQPGHAEAELNLALALWERGDTQASLTGLGDLCVRVGTAQLLEWGDLLARQRRMRHAAACFAEAARRREDDRKIELDLAWALLSAGEYDRIDAARFERLWAGEPSVESLLVLSWLSHERGEPVQAETLCRQALALASDAARPSPQLHTAHYFLSEILAAQRRFPEALAAADTALRLKPDSAEARLARAQTLLRTGEFARGWDDYEWRHGVQGGFAPTSSAPRWSGEALAGKTILLQAEQGFGDTIFAARFAAEVAARGARVVLECPPALVPLMCTAKGVGRAIARGEPAGEVDCSCLMLSLPRVLAFDPGTAPAPMPYLQVPHDRRAQWRGALHGVDGLKVGLCWSGNPAFRADRQRSLPFRELHPLLESPGVAFFSVQIGPAAGQRAGDPRGARIGDLTGRIRDFADTAALVEQLDLVISVDTAVAHLAAALGRPVWLLSRANGDWRWGNHERNLWYPSMRVFHQARLGAWAETILRAREALAEWVRNQGDLTNSPAQPGTMG
jgi:tetratricopeptide (TPR) repeat protein